LNPRDNLVVKAYHMFYQAFPLEPIALNVRLIKNIPIQAGLGGGSSDAAAMLTGLNMLHQDRLSAKDLHPSAARLGSDAPFFLYGGAAIATGRGELITPIPPLKPREVVLVKPRN